MEAEGWSTGLTSPKEKARSPNHVCRNDDCPVTAHGAMDIYGTRTCWFLCIHKLIMILVSFLHGWDVGQRGHRCYLLCMALLGLQFII